MSKDDTFHPRRADREMRDVRQQIEVLDRATWLTLAMCRDGEPYLVTLNYAYSRRKRCFYVHCATEGRKLEILRSNPRVWGQVVEDRGYVRGECTHRYRSVMFRARAEFVQDEAERRRAMEMLTEKFEPEPGPVKQRLLKGLENQKVIVLRLDVKAMSGKSNVAGG